MFVVFYSLLAVASYIIHAVRVRRMSKRPDFFPKKAAKNSGADCHSGFTCTLIKFGHKSDWKRGAFLPPRGYDALPSLLAAFIPGMTERDGGGAEWLFTAAL